MPFYRRRWDESRGDDHDDWGPAIYYFWVHEDALQQQVEVYDSGVRLAYDRYHREDQFGHLSVVPLAKAEWAPFEIDIDTYQREVDGHYLNRTS